MQHAALKLAAPLAAAAVTLLVTASLRAEPLYPEVVNTSHAMPQAAAFFKSYFTAKSEHKPVPTTDHFSEAHLTYIDAALGWPFYNKKGMTEIFEQFMPKWPPTGLSYPTRVSGDMHSAVVAFTDTPELFGGEIRILAAIDFKDGKIVRWIDYWDGRSFGAEAAAKMRTPPDKFPANFDYDVASEGASAKIKDVSQKLAAAFAAGDAAAADALFSNDAVYLDRALRARILGKEAIGKYLGRVLATVPYGKGSKLMHVVGSDQGGGFEWTNDASAVKRGIVAIDLNSAGQIERLDTTWDNGVMSDADLKALVLQSIEK
jgi:ketosteroid isomerase-like protein